MGFFWDVLKDVTKTVINVHSLGAFDVKIAGEDEVNSSGECKITTSKGNVHRYTPTSTHSGSVRATEAPSVLEPFDISKIKFPEPLELSRAAARFTAIGSEYQWTASPDPNDRTQYGVDLFGHVSISGEQRKCHLSGATDVFDGLLIMSVEVYPTWSDPFDRTLEVNKFLYGVTDRMITGIGNGGLPQPSTWFRAKCRRGRTGFSAEKLDILHHLAFHFVPLLSHFYAESEAKRNGGTGILALVQREIENLPMLDWIPRLKQ
jgi:hypothetical protein